MVKGGVGEGLVVGECGGRWVMVWVGVWEVGW